jgi:hypothetical protein
VACSLRMCCIIIQEYLFLLRGDCETWTCQDCLCRLLFVHDVLSRTAVSFQCAVVKSGRGVSIGLMVRRPLNVQRCCQRTACALKSMPSLCRQHPCMASCLPAAELPST